jgi:hypothetical protein
MADNCRYIHLSDITKGGKREKDGSRRPLNRKKIRKIAEHLEGGGETLPLELKGDESGVYQLNGEGNHRFEAAKKANRTKILCRIVA